MALQPKMIACGAKKATLGMLIRFISGPAFMAAASVLVGLKGSRLHAAIVQVNSFFCFDIKVNTGLNEYSEPTSI